MDSIESSFMNLHIAEDINEIGIKFLNFVSKILLDAQYIRAFDVDKLCTVFTEYRVEDLGFHFYGVAWGRPVVKREEFYAILDEVNVMHAVNRTVEILLTYTRNCLNRFENRMNDFFLVRIVESIANCYRSLKICKHFKTDDVCREIETFLTYLVSILAHIDDSIIDDKYSLYPLTCKLCKVLSNTRETRSFLMDLIYEKFNGVHRFLSGRQSNKPLDADVIDGIAFYLSVLKSVLSSSLTSEMFAKLDKIVVADISNARQVYETTVSKYVDLLEKLRIYIPGCLKFALNECVDLFKKTETI